MPTPTYLAKNRHGGFLFRMKIPRQLVPLFNGKEVITKSLGTHHHPTAIKLARRLAAQTECEFEVMQVTKEKYLWNKVIAKGRLTVNREQLEDLRTALDSADEAAQQQAVAAGEALLRQREVILSRLSTAEKKIAIATDIERSIQQQIIRKEVENDYRESPTTPETNSLHKPSPTLAEAMVMYVQSKEGAAKKAHPDKALHKGPADSPYRGYTAYFRLFLATAGNVRTTKLTLAEINKFKSLLGEMKNTNRKEVKPLMDFDYETHQFLMPLEEIREKLKLTSAPPIAPRTVLEYCVEISTFIGWLGMDNDFLPAETCLRMQKTLSPKKAPNGAGSAARRHREPFTTEELIQIYTAPSINPKVSYEPKTKAKRFSSADFWIPLIGLFTGARANEIAMLFTNNIKRAEGIWCIDITLEESTGTHKRLKNENAKRLVPIHQRLIDIGILSFHEEQKQKGETFLFPKLWETKTGESDPYKTWGQKFRRDVLHDHAGIKPGTNKVFHSLRSNLITELQRRGVPRDTREQLAGHSQGSGAHSIYAKGQTITALKDTIDKAVYEGLDFSDINWQLYKAIRLNK